MRMYLDHTQTSTQQPTVTISAHMIESIQILQCSAEELQMSIARELAENPAFESDEVEQCLRCGTPLVNAVCPSCAPEPDTSARDDTLRDLADWEDLRDLRAADLSLRGDEDRFDPLALVRAGDTLPEYLLAQLDSVLAVADHDIAEYLVGNLDSHGYLTVTTEDAARTLDVPGERVERVLAILHTLEPLGVGARNLRECLLIQLRVFREQGEPYPLAERLVERFLDALGEHHFVEIGRELHVTSIQVKQAWRFIRSNLNPFPAHAFEGERFAGESVVTADLAALVKPDVVIRRTATGFEAEVLEQRRYRFGLNPTYQSLAAKDRPRVMSDPEYQHVRQYSARARFFIDCVQQRWDTLKRISDVLIECQREFLDKGVRYLKSLTRSELASMVGLHESTVSRATANKFVLLPTGRTVSFDDFFDNSLATKDTLRELIEGEDRHKPYSDEDLAVLLEERGVHIARRTVAKYREALRILPSRFRI
jgi:RNA polymerase sigma-54 factor